ncbi:MAG: flavin prenyltransferase UbiX [bacterium]|nr:flavin prenyltransferase UbiX [bacterium]
MKIIIAITGASGIIYAQRLIELLLQQEDIEISLSLSKTSALLIEDELKVKIDLQKFNPEELFGEKGKGIVYYHYEDLTANFISGSNHFDAMVIIPCSMGTLARIAGGLSDNIILRTADVALKERRKLILVPRETPLNYIHLRNMLELTTAGAIILPACPGFYHHPKTINELVDFVVWRVLDHL